MERRRRKMVIGIKIRLISIAASWAYKIEVTR